MSPRRFSRSFSASSAASTLIVTLGCLTSLSIMAAYTFARVMPRVHMAHQNAAWQEARVSAEAGIDSAINDLQLNATGFSPGAWTYWQETPAKPGDGSKSFKDTSPLAPVVALLQKTLSILSLDDLLGLGGSPTKPATTDPVVTTRSIYLDNIKVSASSGLPAEMNIQMWALEPSSNPHARWYRIRSMATCALPPITYQAPAKLDAVLRRLSLRGVRPSLKKDDVGAVSSIPLPNVSRTVEVLAEPILSFELALWTNERVSLPQMGQWNVDSFDSTDEKKSNGGKYPGKGSAQVQANGNIASGFERPYDSQYGESISANGVNVSGAVATNGGDDPSTPEHENVTGSINLEAKRIYSDFQRRMTPLVRPAGEFSPPPSDGTFLTGPVDAPTIYSVHGSLQQVRIQSPGVGKKGAVVILIDRDLDLAGPMIIPPSVTAVVFVKGDVTFRDNVNAGPWNSNRAGQLMLFGDNNEPFRQVIRTEGKISIYAALYAPNADVLLDGQTSWMGSIAATTFQATSGDGGLHYDEALATLGPTVGFRIARYIEDVRQ